MTVNLCELQGSTSVECMINSIAIKIIEICWNSELQLKWKCLPRNPNYKNRFALARALPCSDAVPCANPNLIPKSVPFVYELGKFFFIVIRVHTNGKDCERITEHLTSSRQIRDEEAKHISELRSPWMSTITRKLRIDYCYLVRWFIVVAWISDCSFLFQFKSKWNPCFRLRSRNIVS